jgi:hypothetical protein
MMENLKRTNGAHLGVAFLFLSIAAVPVSLKAVGFEISPGRGLRSIANAWTQVACAFSTVHRPDKRAELIALADSTSCEVIARDISVPACTGEANELVMPVPGVPGEEASAATPRQPRRSDCERTKRRQPTTSTRPVSHDAIAAEMGQLAERISRKRAEALPLADQEDLNLNAAIHMRKLFEMVDVARSSKLVFKMTPPERGSAHGRGFSRLQGSHRGERPIPFGPAGSLRPVPSFLL